MSETIMEKARREAGAKNGKSHTREAPCPRCGLTRQGCMPWDEDGLLVCAGTAINPTEWIRKAGRAGEEPCLYAPVPANRGDAWIPEDESAPAPAKRAYSPTLYIGAEFFAADFRREFLVKGVLVRNEPVVLGGTKKTLKSGIAIDIAISLDTATPLLGYESFTVPHRANVLLLNGESGNATVQETASRIARARGIDPNTLRVVWGTDLPKLSDTEHRANLAAIIRERAIEVVVVDPVYLCLLGGGSDGPRPENALEMGPLYAEVAKCCLDAGATPILTIHAKKARENKPLDLDDLLYAGVAEFARQWLLVSRREQYAGDGLHKLWINLGGSAGHSFLGHLDIDEGVIDDEFRGRRWQTTVMGAVEAKADAIDKKEQAKRDKEDAKRKADEEKAAADQQAILRAIDAEIDAKQKGATRTRIRERSGFGLAKVNDIINQLVATGSIEEVEFRKGKGNKARSSVIGYRRCNSEQ